MSRNTTESASSTSLPRFKHRSGLGHPAPTLAVASTLLRDLLAASHDDLALLAGATIPQSRTELKLPTLYCLPRLPSGSQVATHTVLGWNSASPVGSNLNLGGLPLGHGAMPFSSIHRPILAERTSLQPLQKAGDRVTHTVCPASS